MPWSTGSPCSRAGCWQEAGRRGLCDDHRPERERQRGTRQQRQYNAAHDQLRKQWAVKVRAGGVNCARCGEPIAPDEPFDLGHDDHDRSIWVGPEHQRCNRATKGRH